MKKEMMAVSISLCVLALAASAQAHEYRFNCRNLMNVGQLVKVPAVDRKQATLKLKTESAYSEFSYCQYLSEVRDDRKPEDKQNTWGGKVLNGLDRAFKAPPAQPLSPRPEMP